MRPSAKYLKVFGCPVVIKNPGRRPTKLDMNTSAGRFLGYTATDRNVCYLNSVTRHLKIATHCAFDEVGMTLPPADHTPAILALQKAGWTTQAIPRQATQDDNKGEQQGVTPLPHPTANPMEHLSLDPKIHQVNHPPTARTTEGTTQTALEDNPPEPLPELPFDIYFSADPFDKLLPVDIQVKGDHPTLGLKVEPCQYRHRLRLIDMVVSTPASRVP